MASFIMTGAPGAGKTTLLNALGQRGYPVVPEAATDVIADGQRSGTAKPWEQADFIAKIMALQLARLAAAPDRALHDRSVICTLALCRFLGQPVPVWLLAACVAARKAFHGEVFFVRLLGSIANTEARQISYTESQRFEGFHEAAYREFGFTFIEVPPRPITERISLVEKAIRWRAN